MTNMKMMFSYCYYFPDLPVAIFDFQVEGCSREFHNVCQREYVILNDIDFDSGWADFFS